MAVLLRAWLALSAAMAVLSIALPFSIRFEYFAGPAVAMAAGFGAEACAERGGRRLVQAAWWTSAAVALALGAANLMGRFNPISVIIPSPRWPFPVW